MSESIIAPTTDVKVPVLTKFGTTVGKHYAANPKTTIAVVGTSSALIAKALDKPIKAGFAYVGVLYQWGKAKLLATDDLPEVKSTEKKPTGK